MLIAGKITKRLRDFTSLLLLAGVLLCAGTAGADVIDFSNTNGYGLSSSRVMVENIRYDAYITNPFDPSHPTIASYYFDVPFRFDSSTLHLIPDLGGATSIDSNTSCSDLRVEVRDAYTGSLISGAVVMVGWQTAYTNSSGIATFDNLPAGSAQIVGSASGHVTASRVVTLSCSADNGVGLALSPSSGAGAVSANEVRVVLTWGANPSDLDSHLTGPNASGGRFHLYYAGSSDVADLDVDDTSSYGPETVTLSPPSGSSTLRQGLYRYSVHHYWGSSNITNSGAVVSLKIGNNPPRNYSPPGGGSAYNDVWTVFELVVGPNNSIAVYDVNTMQHNIDDGAVQSTSTGLGSVETGVDFTRLPGK